MIPDTALNLSLIMVRMLSLAEISTPLVGSSSRKTRGSAADILPITTFCLLPPLNWLTSCSIDATFIPSASTMSEVNFFSEPLLMT